MPRHRLRRLARDVRRSTTATAARWSGFNALRASAAQLARTRVVVSSQRRLQSAGWQVGGLVDSSAAIGRAAAQRATKTLQQEWGYGALSSAKAMAATVQLLRRQATALEVLASKSANASQAWMQATQERVQELRRVLPDHRAILPQPRPAPFVPLPQHAAGTSSVCFQGAGLLLVYELGVAKYLQQHMRAPGVVLGASGGALVAALLACQVDLDEAFALNCRMIHVSGQRSLGPFIHGLDDLRCHLVPLFPADPRIVAERCNQRLLISLTRIPNMSNQVAQRFDAGREQLVDTVLASMNLPLFGFPPSRLSLSDEDEAYYIDGGLTNNQPRVGKETITVSPTMKTADVHPVPGPPRHRFFLPGDEAFMHEWFQRGYQDAAARLDLLQSKGLQLR